MTNTFLPTTTGEETLRPGTSAFHLTLVLSAPGGRQAGLVGDAGPARAAKLRPVARGRDGGRGEEECERESEVHIGEVQ